MRLGARKAWYEGWRGEGRGYRCNLCKYWVLDGQEGRAGRRKWSGSESWSSKDFHCNQQYNDMEEEGAGEHSTTSSYPPPHSPPLPSLLDKTNFNFNPNWLIAASMRSKFGRNGNLSDWWYKDRSWLIFQDIKISRYFDMNRRYDLTSPEAELLSSESHQEYQGCQPQYKVIPSHLVFRTILIISAKLDKRQ